MIKRRFGKTGLNVSVLGFGGSEIGYESPDQSAVEQLLNEALDAGLNVIDTAECYIDSEDRIGQAVSHRRSDYHLFTKVGHGFETGPELPDWDPKLLELSIEHSLQALRTDYLDLIQLHTCDADVLRQGDAIAVLERAREAGKTRFVGYSGDGEDAKVAIDLGVFDTLQCSLSIADQQAIDLLLPLVRERDMGLIIKRPMANFAWRNGAEPPSSGYAKPYWERLRKLEYPFLSEPDSTETALRFVLSQLEVSTMIVGTKTPGRWPQNAAVVEKGPLPQEELQSIRSRWREVAGLDWVGLT